MKIHRFPAPFQLLALALALILFGASGVAQAKLLEFNKMTSQRLDRLDEEARQHYQLALNYIDRINYEKANEELLKAIEIEKEDVYLRQSALSLTLYLGDTRSGADSLRYYEQTLNHLRVMLDSPTLNSREKERANALYEVLGELRQSVAERDEARMKHGRQIATKYAREIYKGEKPETDSDESPRIRETEKQKAETPIRN